MHLPEEIKKQYKILKKDIKKRLVDFSEVDPEEYFYEMCFCICTPQSKAVNADKVINKLKNKNFREKPFNPVQILRENEHYIRFHNQKSLRLLDARKIFPNVKAILDSDLDNFEKREKITKLVKGYGFKETSHFMRNIGYRGLAILDRHILKHMVKCGVYDEVPKVSSMKQYYEIEQKWFEFARSVKIDPDELDILFWSYETGVILK